MDQYQTLRSSWKASNPSERIVTQNFATKQKLIWTHLRNETETGLRRLSQSAGLARWREELNDYALKNVHGGKVSPIIGVPTRPKHFLMTKTQNSHSQVSLRAGLTPPHTQGVKNMQDR